MPFYGRKPYNPSDHKAQNWYERDADRRQMAAGQGGVFTPDSVIGTTVVISTSDQVVINAKLANPLSPVQAVISFDNIPTNLVVRASIEWGTDGFRSQFEWDPEAPLANRGIIVYSGLQIPVRGTDFRVTLKADTAGVNRCGAFISVGQCNPNPVIFLGSLTGLAAASDTDIFSSALITKPTNYVRWFKVRRSDEATAMVPGPFRVYDLGGGGAMDMAAGQEMDWYEMPQNALNGTVGNDPELHIVNQDVVAMDAQIYGKLDM